MFRFKKKIVHYAVNFYCNLGVVEIKKSFNLSLSLLKSWSDVLWYKSIFQ